MKQYQIQTGMHNKILRQKSKEISIFNNDIKKFEKILIKFMKEKDGVGIAAPQIGKNIQMIICTLDEKNIVTLCNPKIIYFSKNTKIAQEGCLSLPHIWGNVERPENIICRYQNTNGKTFEITLKGMNARIIQHERDHLDGILFADKAIELEASEKADIKGLGF